MPQLNDVEAPVTRPVSTQQFDSRLDRNNRRHLQLHTPLFDWPLKLG
jgi:hypothetical protein